MSIFDPMPGDVISAAELFGLQDAAERQYQAFKRARPSAIDRLTEGERLQLHMEMESLAAKIIANRAVEERIPEGLEK